MTDAGREGEVVVRGPHPRSSSPRRAQQFIEGLKLVFAAEWWAKQARSRQRPRVGASVWPMHSSYLKDVTLTLVETISFARPWRLSLVVCEEVQARGNCQGDGAEGKRHGLACLEG